MRQIGGGHDGHRHLLRRSAGHAAGYHAADPLHLARRGCFRPADNLPAHLRSSALRMLDVLDLGSRSLGDMHCSAANNRAAHRDGRQFRKGHPNRHKLCSLCLEGLCSRPFTLGRRTPVGTKAQREAKATMPLTLIHWSRGGFFASSTGDEGELSRSGTDRIVIATKSEPQITLPRQTTRSGCRPEHWWGGQGQGAARPGH